MNLRLYNPVKFLELLINPFFHSIHISQLSAAFLLFIYLFIHLGEKKTKGKKNNVLPTSPVLGAVAGEGGTEDPGSGVGVRCAQRSITVLFSEYSRGGAGNSLDGTHSGWRGREEFSKRAMRELSSRQGRGKRTPYDEENHVQRPSTMEEPSGAC